MLPILDLRTVVFMVLAVSRAAVVDAQLVVLSTTGEVRDGLPVVQLAPDASAVRHTLERGYSGRLLRLYAREQEFLRRRTGKTPEPAYLVLSDNQGGFPRVGFHLGDDRKPDAGWVDLHRSSRLTGRFGTMDQIFPHELLHVIVRQLAGEPRASGANQIHAVAVRTDPVTAFIEGFAEHAQVLAVDDPDAMADTKSLPLEGGLAARAERNVTAYVRDLSRSWWPIQPSRLRFLLWFGQTEQTQRYHAVKANLFSKMPSIPDVLLAREDRYYAYLVQSVVPGAPTGASKSAAVALATEGVVSHLFWRLVTDRALQQRYRDDEFYTHFGVTRREVSPFDNIYLKMFAVLFETRPSTASEMLRGWARVQPEDASDLDRIVRESLNGQALPDAPEIWLANPALMTGTSLFDQYRGQPRPHTFDINAAMPLDWISVPGITSEAAAQLIAGAPYSNLEALIASPAVSEATRLRVKDMAGAMSRLASASREEEGLRVWAIARAYLWRLSGLVLAASLAGALLARRVGVRRWWTAALVACGATLLVVALAWVITSPAWYPVGAPIVVGGIPWAAWRIARGRGLASASAALAVWAVASLPALMLTRQW